MKKSNFSSYKFLLHVFSDYSSDDYQYFNSLIDLLIYAYDKHFDFSVHFLKSGKIFVFHVSKFLSDLPFSSYWTGFDQYFLGFVSFILTNKERDIFKKKLRGYKHV